LPESRVEAFLRRAGIDADAALRARAEAFLAGRGLGTSALARVPDGLARAWGRCLAAGLPIDYRELMTAPAMPLRASFFVSLPSFTKASAFSNSVPSGGFSGSG